MPRPNTITELQIAKWNQFIEEDAFLPAELKSNSSIRELLLAAHWLEEELNLQSCPVDLKEQFKYTLGEMSFGHDPWQQARVLIEAYRNQDYSLAEKLN